MALWPARPLKVTDIVTTAALASGTANAVKQMEISGVAFTYPVGFYGLLIKLSTAGGTVIVRAWNDASRTQLLGTATIDFTGITDTPVEFWSMGIEAPVGVWVDAIGDATSATKTLNVSAAVLEIGT